MKKQIKNLVLIHLLISHFKKILQFIHICFLVIKILKAINDA